MIIYRCTQYMNVYLQYSFVLFTKVQTCPSALQVDLHSYDLPFF